jgi:hypothetical protein
LAKLTVFWVKSLLIYCQIFRRKIFLKAQHRSRHMSKAIRNSHASIEWLFLISIFYFDLRLGVVYICSKHMLSQLQSNKCKWHCLCRNINWNIVNVLGSVTSKTFSPKFRQTKMITLALKEKRYFPPKIGKNCKKIFIMTS